MKGVEWRKGGSHQILMIPGPTEVPLRVIRAMNQPAIMQYDPGFDVEILDPTLLKLKQVFQTDHEVIVLPGSGRTALEASALSVIEPGDRVVVTITGVFGTLMREIVERAGAQVTEFRAEWGQPLDLDALERTLKATRPKALTLVHNETSTGATYPADQIGKLAQEHNCLFLADTVSSLAGLDIKTDQWGIDFNMAGSQKCLAMPLGLALVAVSQRAWEAMERRSRKASTLAYDLLSWKKQWLPPERGGRATGHRRQPISMPPHLVLALREAVEIILEEGIEHRFERHRIASAAFRAGLGAMKLSLFAHPTLASNTVTGIQMPNGVSAPSVVKRMRDYGIVVTSGIEKTRETIIRIGIMGITASPQYVLPTLATLGWALRDLGHRLDVGEALARAESVFS
ncbi:MAG TPA: alanine--glyoxylate aminotransferase family protein, partial [Methylomirabilota bacterium]|nr:alanine--glyoxylate aminotransferase family protein [Methylomirabilota bacterium]